MNKKQLENEYVVLLHVRFGALPVRVWLAVVNELTVNILARVSLINRYVHALSPSVLRKALKNARPVHMSALGRKYKKKTTGATITWKILTVTEIARKRQRTGSNTGGNTTKIEATRICHVHYGRCMIYRVKIHNVEKRASHRRQSRGKHSSARTLLHFNVNPLSQNRFIYRKRLW